MSTENIVLVAGVHGVSGHAAATEWALQPNTRVYGLSRREAKLPKGVEGIAVDLLDRENVERKLGGLDDITHVVFAAYIEKADAAERSQVNVAILRNLVEVVEKASPGLRHITFYQGGKAYGSDLGPFKTPAREDDPRLMSPNFYYDQEDFLRRQQAGKSWRWTALRPEGIIRLRHRQPDEPGRGDCRLCDDLEGTGHSVALPGFSRSLSCALSGQFGGHPSEGDGVGRWDTRRRGRNLQHHQW